MTDLRVRLLRCFGLVFPDLSEAEMLHASRASLARWDSLAMITLMAVLEEEFGVAPEPEELADLESFDLILAYLEERHAGS